MINFSLKTIGKTWPSLLVVTTAILSASRSLCQINPDNARSILDSNAVVKPFAPGVINTGLDEMAVSFSPNNKTVYYMLGGPTPAICYTNLVNGRWSKPSIASFSGRWSDMDPAISPDGKKIFFSSNRPLPGAPQNKENKNSELWYVNRLGNGQWGTPKHLDSPVNTGGESNYAPSVDAKGTLYFCSKDREGNKGVESFYCIWSADHYERAKVLTVPGVSHIHDPFIAANGRYIVFYTGKNFYVTFINGNTWSQALKLGPPVSLGDDIICPYVSHDGKMLYFSTDRIAGFYKRNQNGHLFTFDELVNENMGIFNGRTNILMVPVNLPSGN